MNKYFYHVNSGGAVFIKEAEFFKAQGGLNQKWGENWKPIDGTSIENARERARLREGIVQTTQRSITPLERSMGRSEDYHSLPSEDQWAEDKRLGMLDWDGNC